MNDLGMTLAWSAVQVSLVMVPAVALHALASRRSAASGSWIAALGLALSVVITVAHVHSLAPGSRRIAWSVAFLDATVAGSGHDAATAASDDRGVTVAFASTGQHGIDLSLSFAALQQRLEPVRARTAAPLDRVRPWGSVVAVAGIAGAGIGLVRLLLGLWAVRLCRRRGTIDRATRT